MPLNYSTIMRAIEFSWKREIPLFGLQFNYWEHCANCYLLTELCRMKKVQISRNNLNCNYLVKTIANTIQLSHQKSISVFQDWLTFTQENQWTFFQATGLSTILAATGLIKTASAQVVAFSCEFFTYKFVLQSITAGGYIQRADSKVSVVLPKIQKNLNFTSQSLRAVFDKYASLTVDGQTYMTDEDFVIKYLVRWIFRWSHLKHIFRDYCPKKITTRSPFAYSWGKSSLCSIARHATIHNLIEL